MRPVFIAAFINVQTMTYEPALLKGKPAQTSKRIGTKLIRASGAST